MLVNQLLGEARKRLTTIGAEALLIDAARALSGRPRNSSSFAIRTARRSA